MTSKLQPHSTATGVWLMVVWHRSCALKKRFKRFESTNAALGYVRYSLDTRSQSSWERWGWRKSRRQFSCAMSNKRAKKSDRIWHNGQSRLRSFAKVAAYVSNRLSDDQSALVTYTSGQYPLHCNANHPNSELHR